MKYLIAITTLWFAWDCAAARLDKDVRMPISIHGSELSKLIKFLNLTDQESRTLEAPDEKNGKSIQLRFMRAPDRIVFETEWSEVFSGFANRAYFWKLIWMSYLVSQNSTCIYPNTKNGGWNDLLEKTPAKFEIENNDELSKIAFEFKKNKFCLNIARESKSLHWGQIQ